MPTGLFRRIVTLRACSLRAAGSMSMRCSGRTRWPSTAISPSTRTQPAAIQSSASRREAMPCSVSALDRRMPSARAAAMGRSGFSAAAATDRADAGAAAGSTRGARAGPGAGRGDGFVGWPPAQSSFGLAARARGRSLRSGACSRGRSPGRCGGFGLRSRGAPSAAGARSARESSRWVAEARSARAFPRCAGGRPRGASPAMADALA